MSTRHTFGQSLLYLLGLNLWFATWQRRWCTEEYKKTDCWSEEGIAAVRSNGTDLKVVLPSFGQTGTTSIVEALRQLGVRAYHADDFSVLAKPVMFDKVDWGLWSRTVSRCRMEAISLEPVTDLLPVAVAKAQKAKFIITWRPYAAWRRSSSFSQIKERRLDTILLPLYKGNDFVPWVEMLDAVTGLIRRERQKGDPYFGNFSAWGYMYRQLCNGYAWPVTNYKERGSFRGDGEEAYLAHIDEIRRLVPKERLVIFDIKRHGWGEIEEIVFGNRSSTPRGPFPRPRSNDMRTNEPLVERQWRITGPAMFFFAVLHAMNFFLMRLIYRPTVEWLGRKVPEMLEPPEPPSGDWEDALGACPMVALLEGVQPSEVEAVGQALADAGVRLLVVSFTEPWALQSLQVLAASPPQGTMVGASGVVKDNHVCSVREAGGSFVISPNVDCGIVRRAAALGLVTLPGASSISEALAALGHGAYGVSACPPQGMPPAEVKAWCAELPPGTSLIVMGMDAHSDCASYTAAGARGVGISSQLYRPGDSPAVVRQKADALLATCRAATAGAGA